MREIGIGVVAGLVTTVLTWMLWLMWVRILSPWWEDFVYRDTKIEGRWKAHYTGDDSSERSTERGTDIATLFRQGHRVWGDIVETKGEQRGREWSLEGEFRNTILTLTYNSKSRQEMDRGTITLILRENGQSLDGYTAYYNDEDNRIEALPYSWERDRT